MKAGLWQRRGRVANHDEPVSAPASGTVVATGPDVLTKLHVEVTTRCNLDCAMCVRQVSNEGEHDMAASTFAALVNGVSDLSEATSIQFGGFGEPLLHPDLPVFVHLATSMGMGTEVVTNGALLTPDRGLALLRAGLKILIVPYGGGPSTTAPTRQNVTRLRRLARQERLAFPRVKVHAVVHRGTVAALEDVRAFARSLQADTVSLSHVLPHTGEMRDQALFGNRLPSVGTSPNAPPSMWWPEVILPVLEWEPREAAPLASLLRGQANVRFGATRVDFGQCRCPFITEGRAAVDWQGDLAPCLPLLREHPVLTVSRSRVVRRWHVGNVAQTPFGWLWRAPEYAQFRRRVDDFDFPPCPNCGGCEMIEPNETDCYNNQFPVCGDCLYARGLVRCP